MTNRVQTNRLSAAGVRPSGRPPGELYANFADGQLGVVTPVSNLDLIAVRFFSPTANYALGDHVIQGGFIYRAIVAVSAGTFNPAQWVKQSSDTNLPATGGTMTGPLILNNSIITDDINQAADRNYVRTYADGKIAKTGDQMTGPLILNNSTITDDYNQAADRNYVRNYADGKIAKTGDTMTGVLIAPQVETLSQTIVQSGGVINIDINKGQNCDLILTGNVTTINVVGWPTVMGIGGRVRLKVVNTGTFTMTGYPTGTVWPGNTQPVITANATDIIELFSNNSGATIYGSVVGVSYAVPITSIDGLGAVGAARSNTQVSASITTARTQNIILAFVHCETPSGSPIATVSGGGLTWARRSQLNFVDTYNARMEVWWAQAPTVLTNVAITAVFSGLGGQFDAASIQLIAVHGVANLATPWDVNASLPATQTRPFPNPFSVSLSTTAAHTMLFGFNGANTAYGATPGAGFIGLNQIQISGPNLESYNYAMYQIFNSAQSGYNATMIANAFSGAIFDALVLT